MEQRDAFVLNRIEVGTGTAEGRDPVVLVTLYGDAGETEREIATVAIPLDKVGLLTEALTATRSGLLLRQLSNQRMPRKSS